MSLRVRIATALRGIASQIDSTGGETSQIVIDAYDPPKVLTLREPGVYAPIMDGARVCGLRRVD